MRRVTRRGRSANPPNKPANRQASAVAFGGQFDQHRDMLRSLLHIGVIVFLTLLTQIGGIAWLMALAFRRTLLAFVLFYVGLSAAAVWIAPGFGRVPLSCVERGPLAAQSWISCALNRNYVTPELADVLSDTAEEMHRRHPGTITLFLDANFPFFDGFPLLPHLSHDDGKKADLAFYYADSSGYRPGAVRSPIGYFAFEQGPTDCPSAWPTLRWDFNALQPLWRDFRLEPDRNRAVLDVLSKDPRVGRIFVEPHLAESLGATGNVIGFQGCRAARHNDHIHLQLR
ncbi:hypothetical protein M2324_000955 [Rhodovulum sulfidophilum]|uniref:DUF4172 domain-containing protein n=1 Tax=Rhodovulum sulfidophilum TaxID=35806 RepID=UPI000AF34556|nr:DUF4172 domain-containing protein [Rhodovulum sulfidophilum]MCW2302571.1 hypothetical protein [Rhodovulum sulfidophilum]